MNKKPKAPTPRLRRLDQASMGWEMWKGQPTKASGKASKWKSYLTHFKRHRKGPAGE